MNNTDIAWLAGMMEGEGTFAIYHQKRKGENGDQLKATISIANTDPALINKCHEVFKEIGVEMHISEYWNKKSTRPVYEMKTAKHTNVKLICEALLPYLFGEKKAKAQMLIRFVDKRLKKLGENRDTIKGKYDEEDWGQFNSFRSSETTREASTEEDIVRA